VKVVRSPSEILALIKTCDSTTIKNDSSAVQPASSTINNYASPLQLSQNISKKVLNSIQHKKILKPNVRASEIEDHQEVKENVTQTSNILGSKKLVLLISYSQIFYRCYLI